MHKTSAVPGAPDGQSQRKVKTARPHNIECGVNLSKRRRWYAEGGDQQGQNGGAPGADAGAGSSQTTPTGGTGDEISSLPEWAQRIISDLRGESAEHRRLRREAETAKAELERKRQEEEAARLAEQGRWKELAEQREQELLKLKPAAEQASALTARIQAANTARIERIPEALRTIVPTDYDPVKLSEWLDANADKLTAQKAPDLDGGRRGDRGTPLPDPKTLLPKIRL